MTISNAIPIQFWLTGQTSFNDKTEAGVVSHCFNQPFKCTDEINLQFTDTEERDYRLGIYDTDGVKLATVNFTKAASGDEWVYYCAFTPSVIGGLCDKLLQFKIAYFETVLEGDVDDYIETGTGTVTFNATFFELVGDVDDFIETVSGGEMVNSQSDSFKLGEVSEGAMCAASPETLYFGPGTWGTGTFMFMDKELTSPVLGYLFICKTDGVGYNMDDATGEVLTTTGNVC